MCIVAISYLKRIRSCARLCQAQLHKSRGAQREVYASIPCEESRKRLLGPTWKVMECVTLLHMYFHLFGLWWWVVEGGWWVCGLWTPKYFTDFLDYRIQDTKRLFGLFDLNCPPII